MLAPPLQQCCVLLNASLGHAVAANTAKGCLLPEDHRVTGKVATALQGLLLAREHTGAHSARHSGRTAGEAPTARAAPCGGLRQLAQCVAGGLHTLGRGLLTAPSLQAGAASQPARQQGCLPVTAPSSQSRPASRGSGPRSRPCRWRRRGARPRVARPSWGGCLSSGRVGRQRGRGWGRGGISCCAATRGEHKGTAAFRGAMRVPAKTPPRN